jgi:hypothetical protein
MGRVLNGVTKSNGCFFKHINAFLWTAHTNNRVFTRYATFKICSCCWMAGEENNCRQFQTISDNFRQFQFLALPRTLGTRLGRAGRMLVTAVLKSRLSPSNYESRFIWGGGRRRRREIAGKHRSTTNLSYILAHNLQTEFKAEFYKRIRYIRPCRAN